MGMSKKDFIALADALRSSLKYQEGQTTANDIKADIRRDLCGAFRSINPRFMADRWEDYLDGKCGPNGGAVKVQKAFGASSFKPFKPQA